MSGIDVEDEGEDEDEDEGEEEEDGEGELRVEDQRRDAHDRTSWPDRATNVGNLNSDGSNCCRNAKFALDSMTVLFSNLLRMQA